MSEACVIISDAYIDEGQYYKALDYATKGLEIAQEMGSPGLTRDASKRLYDIYKHNGDMSNALKMHELYIDAKEIPCILRALAIYFFCPLTSASSYCICA